MEIDGPLKIGVIDPPDTPGWELRVDFTDEFKGADLERQGRLFAEYIQRLEEGIERLPPGDRNRDGMAIVLQLCRELMPYIQEGQIALEETIAVQIGKSQAVSLTDLLDG